MAKRKASKRKISKRKTSARKTSSRYWSQRVTEESDALTLEEGVFTKLDPARGRASLKRSAEASHRRKSSPYRSAMSMLVFYINRAGKGLSKAEKTKLEKAKDELRALYGKQPAKTNKTKKKGRARKAG